MTNRLNDPNACDVCGGVTVRNSAIQSRNCMNCGNSMGIGAGDDRVNNVYPKIDPDSLSPVGKRYRQRQTGIDFRFICIATHPQTEMKYAVYRQIEGEPRALVRKLSEFCDGRFEVIE